MTFKHLKFEDSPVMRSLEKVAIEKGLVAPQFMIKQAQKQHDFSASMNLSENIIKLCDGLRSCGLESKAEELENNYLDYKKAQTLYETPKETGEDLVHSAHPKGSHKLDGVEGDSVIETIIDQHLQALKMIDKKPTGKLSTANEIIKSVKVVLSQDTTNEAQIVANLNKVLNIIQRIQVIAQGDISMPQFGWNVYFEKVNAAIADSTIDKINKVKEYFNTLYGRLKPGVIMGVTDDTWSVIQPLFGAGNAAIERALIARQKVNEARSKDVAGDIVDSDKPERVGVTVVDAYGLSTSIKSALSTLNGYRAAINTDDSLEEADKNTALTWISSRIAAINNIKVQYDSLENDEEKAIAAPRMLENLRKITAKFNNFYQGWIANA
jgi:hypothetical protein